MRFWDINCTFFILVDMQGKNSTDRLYLAKVIIRLTVDICFFLIRRSRLASFKLSTRYPLD